MKRKGDHREAASEGSVEPQPRPDAQEPDDRRHRADERPYTREVQIHQASVT